MRYASHANTGLWMGYELDWQIDPESGNLNYDAEKIEGVYGADEEEWQTNCLLKLGDFDEEAGDRYELVEV